MVGIRVRSYRIITRALPCMVISGTDTNFTRVPMGIFMPRAGIKILIFLSYGSAALNATTEAKPSRAGTKFIVKTPLL